MDLKKLSRGEQIICISGIVLFIFSFFKWYAVDFGGGKVGDVEIPGVSVSANGWDTTLGLLAAIIGLVMVAQILLTKFSDVKLPDLGSVTWGQVHLGLGALAALFMIIRLIDAGDGIDRKIGLFVSFVAGIGLAVGGYLKFQEEKAGGSAPRPPAA